MRIMFRVAACAVLSAAGFVSIPLPPAMAAGPVPAAALYADIPAIARIDVDWRWYGYRPDDDDFYYPPEYYLPPPPVDVYPDPPPAVVYEPPVYGWSSVPLAPSSCGKYRYWNGDRCADARDDPPDLGPRW